MNAQNLDKITMGVDRGVAIPAVTSADENHDYTDNQKSNLVKKEARRKRYQRIMARRQKGSGRWKKTSLNVARCHTHASHVRLDFAHKASRKIVDSNAEVIVFEDLKVKNMTKEPEPKPADNGTGAYLPNGAAAKAGLNKAILESAWGKVRLFTTYKAKRANKLVIAVPPYCTSQECSKCSHTHPDNRQSRAIFECQHCGFTANADFNASISVKNRGIRMLVAGEIAVKQTKRAMRLKKKQQLGREPAEVTRGEMEVRRSEGTCLQVASVGNRETPTTTVLTI